MGEGKQNTGIRGKDVCFLPTGVLLLLQLQLYFPFQSENSDKSSAESDSETEVEQISVYHKLLATLKSSPESESEEDVSDSEEAGESETEMGSEGSQGTGEADGSEEAKNDVQEHKEGSLFFPCFGKCFGLESSCNLCFQLQSWCSRACWLAAFLAWRLLPHYRCVCGSNSCQRIW